MDTFKEMHVWRKAMELAVEIYKQCDCFPKDETFGLISQMRRCSISIPSNIAEGFGRNSRNELHRFANIAIGSLFELQTQLELSLRLHYLNQESYERLYEHTREIERMLASLTRKLVKQHS